MTVMDARCNRNAKFDCKQNDSKTFRINFDQWCCCYAQTIKAKNWEIQPTLIQLKTWYFLQKLIVCLLSFDLFISSKVSRLHNFYTVLIVCITLHQSVHWLLLFSDQQHQHDNKEKEANNTKMDSMRVHSVFFKFISHLYMLCIHTLRWPLRMSFSEIEQSTLAISCALLITVKS